MTMITGFIPVFEERFKKLLKTIEKEYEKPKGERNRENMKRLSKEAKSLRQLFKECKEEMGNNCCPHCGKELGGL